MMSDLIRRQDAIDAVFELSDKLANEMLFIDAIVDEIENLPSAESERIAKVVMHKYWLGVSLNVVSEHTIGYEWICENCKKKVVDGDDYCSHCGAKLIWGEDDE